MTKNRKLYDTLGVPPDATHEQIRTAYRARAKQIHPDNQETGDSVEFTRLQLAHATLTDTNSRAHYDQTGDETGGGQNRSESSIEAQALSLISNISQQIIDGGFGVDCDLTLKIRETLRMSLAQHRANRDNGQKMGDQLRRKVETINRRWTGADLAKSVVIGGLQQRIDATASQLLAVDSTIAIWEMAVTLMDGAIYEMPIAQPTPTQIQYIVNGRKISI